MLNICAFIYARPSSSGCRRQVRTISSFPFFIVHFLLLAALVGANPSPASGARSQERCTRTMWGFMGAGRLSHLLACLTITSWACVSNVSSTGYCCFFLFFCSMLQLTSAPMFAHVSGTVTRLIQCCVIPGSCFFRRIWAQLTRFGHSGWDGKIMLCTAAGNTCTECVVCCGVLHFVVAVTGRGQYRNDVV